MALIRCYQLLSKLSNSSLISILNPIAATITVAALPFVVVVVLIAVVAVVLLLLLLLLSSRVVFFVTIVRPFLVKNNGFKRLRFSGKQKAANEP